MNIIPEWVKSVRSLLAVEIVSTYCLIALGITAMTILKVIEVNVFLAFIAGFAGTVGTIITFYFLAKKRDGTEKNGGEIK